MANHSNGREHGSKTRGVVSLSICRKHVEAKAPVGDKAASNSLKLDKTSRKSVDTMGGGPVREDGSSLQGG